MSGLLKQLPCLVILILPAHASPVVNIDIQPSGGLTITGGAAAVLPSPGSFWNSNGPNGRPQELLRSDGSGSGLSLTSDLFEAPFPGHGDALYRDYMIGGARIGGLAAGADYEVVFYGGANLMTSFIVGQSFTRLSPEPAYCPPGHRQLPGIDACDYVRGIITADDFGGFSVDVNLGALAGLQIALPASNPEPTAMTLLPLSALVVFRRRMFR